MKKAYFKYPTILSDLTTQGKKAIVLISVGQPYHESQYLMALVNLINKSGFASCDIVVADTLQRHNYCIQHDEVTAYSLALANGEDWISRNLKILSKLNVKSEIIRWDFWLENTSYDFYKDKVDFSYEFENAYKQAIDNTIHVFATRFLKRFEKTDSCENKEATKFNISSCLEYVKEECAIIMPLWASLGYDFIIYPKTMTSAMEETYNKFVKSIYNKAYWLSLRFK